MDAHLVKYIFSVITLNYVENCVNSLGAFEKKKWINKYIKPVYLTCWYIAIMYLLIKKKKGCGTVANKLINQKKIPIIFHNGKYFILQK